MKKLSISLLLLAAVSVSCHNGSGNMTNKCGPCPLYADAVELLIVKVKIVSKTNGADLFLSPGSPYKPSDLQVSSSATGPNYQFTVDTMDTNNRSVWLRALETQTYKVQLASLGADNITVVAGLSDQKCCATLQVKSVIMNDSLVCSPCTAQQVVTIRK